MATGQTWNVPTVNGSWKKKKPRSEGDKKILTFPTIIEIKLLYIYKILHT